MATPILALVVLHKEITIPDLQLRYLEHQRAFCLESNTTDPATMARPLCAWLDDSLRAIGANRSYFSGFEQSRAHRTDTTCMP